MGSARGTLPAQCGIVKTRVFPVFLSVALRVEQCSQCCASVGPSLARSCRQWAPSCAMLNINWTYMCITWLQLILQLIWAQLHQPNMANWPSLDASWAPHRATWAQVGTVRATSAPDAPTQDQVAHGCVFFSRAQILIKARCSSWANHTPESYPESYPRIRKISTERFFWGCLGLQWPQQS